MPETAASLPQSLWHALGPKKPVVTREALTRVGGAVRKHPPAIGCTLSASRAAKARIALAATRRRQALAIVAAVDLV